MESAKMDRGFDKIAGINRPLIYYVLKDLKYLLQARYCKLHGHDWEDDSWAGPDSGGMAGHCKRCGFSFEHTLY